MTDLSQRISEHYFAVIGNRASREVRPPVVAAVDVDDAVLDRGRDRRRVNLEDLVRVRVGDRPAEEGGPGDGS